MTERRPEPQGTTQAAGRVAENVVAGLQSQPMLLAVIVLNVCMLVAASWFLSSLAAAQQARWDTLIKACLQKVGELQ